MAFISSSKNSSNEDGNTVCVTTASTAFPTGSVNVAIISQDTASAYIASQSNGSQIKLEDINQIDEDDIEEMDIKWNMDLLSMRVDKFWKRTGKKISIQGSDVAGFDKSKVECFNCHKMDHFARECRAPKSQEKRRKESYKQGSKAEEKISKALVAIDGAFAYCSQYLSRRLKQNPSTSEDVASPNPSKPLVKRRVQRETTRSQNHPYKSPSHRSGGHKPHGAPMRPPLRSSGPRPHRGSMRPSHRSASHRPHGPLMNPRRPTMNGARPYKSFFIQSPLYETRPFLKSSAVKTPYIAPWVPTANMNDPPVNRKFST
nr:hypothetical protein [Tanacetum cinerariifolium]